MAAPPASTRAMLILISMKTRLIWNTLRARQGFWNLLVILLFAVCWCVFVAREAASLTTFLGMLFLADPARQLLSAAIAYALLIVFTSDILMGHTMNTGQMSTDMNFLSTLPASPGSLLIVKLYERLMTDWLGFIILFSSFLGLAWPGHFTLEWVLMPSLVYVEIELLTGMALTLIGTLLQRLFRPAAIENMFSLLGYLCAFIGLAPFIIISSAPIESAMALLNYTGNFSGFAGLVLTPIRWLADSLLDGTATSSFFRFQLLWLALLAAGTGLFFFTSRWNWITWVHPGRKLEIKSSRHLLSGLIRKEAILLRSDWNILTNSLMMPISIIALQIWAFREFLTVNPETRGMNMMAAALMYFSMFGPMNSMGSEGKAISLLETLPVPPGHIIRLKTFFWSFIADVCFIPASIFAGIYLGFSSHSIFRIVLWLLLVTPALIWTAVSMSALYAKYEGKVLQQRSYLAAKLFTPLVMGLIVSVKDFSFPSILNAVVFLMLAFSLHLKGVEALERRLDPDGLRQPCFKATDALLTIIIVLGVQRIISTVASLAVPPELQGLWPWLLAYVINIPFLAYTCLTYARDRFSAPAEALGWRRCNHLHAVEALVTALLLGGITRGWLGYLGGKGLYGFAAGTDIRSAAQDLLGQQAGVALVFAGFCLIAPIVEETFFRGFLSRALSGLGWTGTGGILLNGIVFSLIYPPAFILPAVFLGITTASLFRRAQSLWPVVLLHSVWSALVLMIHAGWL